VAELLGSAADGEDVVPGPPVPDVLAVALELGDQGPDVGVVRVAGGGQPEPAEHGPRLGLPLQVDLAGLVGGEHPAHQVALRRGRDGPVGEQLAGRRVGGQHVPAAPLDQGGERLEALDQVGHRGVEALGRGAVVFAVVVLAVAVVFVVTVAG
jgi:hypothetical protein